jgi:hypothetical protein
MVKLLSPLEHIYKMQSTLSIKTPSSGIQKLIYDPATEDLVKKIKHLRS